MDIPLKRTVLEPKVYAVMVESARGQVLHLGVHFSLEEAYAAARQRMEMLSPHSHGEAMDIDLWNTMSARQVIAQLMDPAGVGKLIPLPEGAQTGVKNPDILPDDVKGGIDQLPPMLQNILKKKGVSSPPVSTTLSESVKEVKGKKNDLMKKLIADADENQVEKLKSLLGPDSYRYVLQAIKKNNPLK